MRIPAMNPLCQNDSITVSQLNVSQKGQESGFQCSDAIKLAGILTMMIFSGRQTRQQVLAKFKIIFDWSKGMGFLPTIMQIF